MMLGIPPYTARIRCVSSIPACAILVVCILLAGLSGPGCGSGSDRPDQSDPYRNRLADEISPYLQSHANNPVDWYPWGREAIERARREEKPIFLSVGYSTCYWCHVMEREVFSDPDIAAVMNAHFVNVKVDREERPDIDEIYMTATQLVTGSGGWPNSVFLTPDLEPFFAGTYFPPEDLPGRPGFPRVLNLLNEAWNTRRGDLVEQAVRIAEAIRTLQQDLVAGDGSTIIDGSAAVDEEIVAGALTYMRTRYDVENGGFGPAPKFPPPMRLELLLNEYERTGDETLLSMATHTLDVMMNGGVYDHVGGGFHRYATDSDWRIPHFEKMLYNQADLARVYLLAYDVTGRDVYRAVAEDVLNFLGREMTGDEGAFYSAVDSETAAVEGRYYLWSEAEIRKTLGADSDAFLANYGLAPMPDAVAGSTGQGNPERASTGPAEDAAEGPTEDAAKGAVLYIRGEADSVRLRSDLELMRSELRTVRAKRSPPMVDAKVITAWNGQMIDAYAYAWLVTGEREYLDRATRAAEFILERLRDGEGRLRRIYLGGETRREAFQEDYAYLARGLTRLFEATEDDRWLAEARSLADRMNGLFWDSAAGGYYFTSDEQDLIVRTRNPYDGARASGNAMAAHALLALAGHTGETRYRARAARLFEAFAPSMEENPGRFTSMILALRNHLYGEREFSRRRAVHDGRDATADVLMQETVTGTGVARTGADFNDSAKVEAHLEAAAAGGDAFDATVSIRIADGWHINANPASLPGLVPTAVTFNADVPIQVDALTYPEGEAIRFSFADGPLEVYRGAIRLRARLVVEAVPVPEDTRLYATLYYQACNDTVCLEPGEVALSVRLGR
ncbi:MAG: DUF255 domain-containing protein [Gemmatimonadetes bacterium]|nr:DUF255 domain-containing protein [Gemmatimonadota bacterium]